MIYDEIKNIYKYKELSKWFDLAIDFIEDNDLSKLPLGKIQLANDYVFLNVSYAEPKAEEDISYEVHKKYADIQIDIEGCEVINMGYGCDNKVIDYNPNTDFGTAECSTFVSCVMGEGKFIICMPDEAHKPCIQYKDCTKVKKCVIKVRAD